MKLNVTKPTLLLDIQKAQKNIALMAEKAITNDIRFRPHFKTHQSAEIGKWFKKFGTESATVSSVEMAEYFANNGWTDITIAFPVNVLEIERINKLAKRVMLNLLVESVESVQFLKNNLVHNVEVWIKIDTGYHRTGILWDNREKLLAVTEQINRTGQLTLSGILTHAGHSYHTQSKTEIIDIFRLTLARMNQAKKTLTSAGYEPIEISIGDTPGCSLITDFTGVDEIRPGNFVFYDVTQFCLGVCELEQIAVALACPVVAKYPDRNEVVVYGGAIHLSKEFIEEKTGSKIYGYVVQPGDNEWGALVNQTYVSALSQEHGIVKTNQEFIDKIKVGDFLLILPVHSCLTVNLMKYFYTMDGEVIKTMQSK